MHRITQILKLAALTNPSGLATIDIRGRRKNTWKQFEEDVNKLAAALRFRGLREGDRVAVLSQNSDTHLKYFFAVIQAGGIVVPLHSRSSAYELKTLLKDCEPSMLVVDDQNYSKVQGECHNIYTIYAGDEDAPDGLIDHESLLQSGSTIIETKRGGEDIALIIYTGGTTGMPKGVMLTHQNVIRNARTALSMLKTDRHMIYLHAAPMYHIADAQWNIIATMTAGTHVFMKRFKPRKVLSAIEQFRISHVALVPTMLNMLCEVPEIYEFDVSSLKKINVGGSPLTPDVIENVRTSLPACELIQGYGLTETSPNVTMLEDRYHTPGNPKMASVGWPVDGMRVKIVDSSGNELPRGTTGEIITKGEHVMAGYWKNPEETRKALQDGWLHTGDLGYLDQDGALYIVDRLKDMIITGGENVYSKEVEDVINNMDGVDASAVIGLPDETWGESVHAIVVPKAGDEITDEMIHSHCRKYLAHYKCPKSIDIRSKPLPMSGPGKILKRELRKSIQE